MATSSTTIIPVKLETIDQSEFVKTRRVILETDAASSLVADNAHVHDSVSVLLYCSDNDSLIFVKQFRPSVYLHRTVFTSTDWNTMPPPSSFCDSSSAESIELGYTLELCDGIIDKPNRTIIEIARQEIVEECGYDVPIEKIELITRTRSPDTGASQTLLYAEVNETMKQSDGGGNINEGEKIEVISIPVAEARRFLVEDECVQRAADLMFCVLWFLQEKWRNK